MEITPKTVESFEKEGRGVFFSRFICRVGGLPTDTFRLMRGTDSIPILDALHDVQRKLRRHKETATDVLYDAVGDSSNSEQRGAFLQIKRDVYNLRPLDDDDLARARQTWSDSTRRVVETYRDLMRKQRKLRSDLRETYHDETCRARRVFRQHVQNADFQKGLLISSRSLFSAQTQYLESDVASLGGRERSIERGLLRYLSRTAMKATPFGTFCAVLPGSFVEGQGSEEQERKIIELEGDPQDKESQVRLNKSLFGILQRHLKDRPAVHRHFNVELNPTLRRHDDELRFLANVDGQEVFQRLPENPVLDIIADLLAEGGRKPLRELVAALHQHPDIAASEEEATQYLDRLLEIGFLRFRLGISEQEVAWDRPLQRLLEPIDDEHARRTVDLLRTLRVKIEAYDDAPVAEREHLLDEMTETVDEALTDMEVAASVPKDLPLYEDATAEATTRMDWSSIRETEETLAQYLSLTLPLSSPRKERINMRHFYEEHYDESSVSLLRFYEEYYRNHYKEHLEKKRKSRRGEEIEDYDVANPFGLDEIERIQDARSQIREHVVAQWRKNAESEVIDIELKDLAEITNDLPSLSKDPYSVSLFAQPFSQDEEERTGLIVPDGKYLAGYGKYFSRFLYLFDEEVTEHLQDTNAELTDHHVAEICGDAHFNANLHPPLLPWEISYPTGESGQADIQLRSSNLRVEPDLENEHEIRVHHRPSEKKVFPVDLGFLNPRMRPPLYQLLSRFTPTASFRLPIPDRPTSAESDENESSDHASNGQLGEEPRMNGQAEEEGTADEEAEPTVVRRPRIRLNGQVVLARQQWWVPSTQFPERRENEDDVAYFARVDRWRREHGMPSEVYVRLRPLSATEDEADEETALEEDEPAEELHEAPTEDTPTAAEEGRENGEPQDEDDEGSPAQQRQNRTRRSRDYHKPQYIDFQNPLLVNLFGKLTVNLDRYVATVEERFPEPTDLPETDGQRYTNELILQMDVPAE